MYVCICDYMKMIFMWFAIGFTFFIKLRICIAVLYEPIRTRVETL